MAVQKYNTIYGGAALRNKQLELIFLTQSFLSALANGSSHMACVYMLSLKTIQLSCTF